MEKGVPWGLENPDHGEGKLSIWIMPTIARLRANQDVGEVNFDQCSSGLSTTKPTKLHEVQSPYQGLLPDGTPYKAAHESTVQWWVTGPTGKRERASRAQGKAIALAQ